MSFDHPSPSPTFEIDFSGVDITPQKGSNLERDARVNIGIDFDQYRDYLGDNVFLPTGGEEALKDQFGNDIDESGVIGYDRLVYYDAPSGIYADLSLGLVQDGYGSTDQATNFERLYGSFYDDTVKLCLGAGVLLLLGEYIIYAHSLAHFFIGAIKKPIIHILSFII